MRRNVKSNATTGRNGAQRSGTQRNGTARRGTARSGKQRAAAGAPRPIPFRSRDLLIADITSLLADYDPCALLLFREGLRERNASQMTVDGCRAFLTGYEHGRQSEAFQEGQRLMLKGGRKAVQSMRRVMSEISPGRETAVVSVSVYPASQSEGGLSDSATEVARFVALGGAGTVERAVVAAHRLAAEIDPKAARSAQYVSA